MTNKEKQELKRFLAYLLDKLESCYYNECKSAVREYLKELGIQI